jgi:tRNA A37 threonylcarbamoyladenosine dehydratase
MSWLQRTELLIGSQGIERLRQANVLLVGLGGVGSYAAEFLGRSGIGRMTIVDGDTVDPTNKNRQLVALDSTIGQNKAEVMAARLREINPDLQLTVVPSFLDPGEMKQLVTPEYDWALDCIDSVQPKQYFIKTAVENGVRIVSSMGAGGRVDPLKIRVAPLAKTKNCPFAHQVRKGLRRKEVSTRSVVAVYSEELVDKEHMMLTDGTRFKKSFYGTISYIPALFGLTAASVVIRALVGGGDELPSEDEPTP